MNFQQFVSELACQDAQSEQTKFERKEHVQRERITLIIEPQLKSLVSFHDYTLQFQKGIAPQNRPITISFSKHFESQHENPQPISYFEVLIRQAGNKTKQFAVGLTVEDIHDPKMIGDSHKSIGLKGEGKIRHNASTIHDLHINCCQTSDVIGVGVVHKSQDIFFTHRGKQIFSTLLPIDMRNKKLYPAITFESREDIIVMNFGNGERNFAFDLDAKKQEYYQRIYNRILQQPQPDISSVEKLIKDYLEHQGFFSTIKAVDHQDEKTIQIQSLDQNIFAQSKNNESSSDSMMTLTKRNQSSRNVRLFSMREDSFYNQPRIDRGESFLSEQDDSIMLDNPHRPRFESQIIEKSANMNTIQQGNPTHNHHLSQYGFDLPIRKKLRKLIMQNKISEAIEHMQENFPNLYSTNLIIQCSLLSIEFLNLLKNRNFHEGLEFFKANLTQCQDSFNIITKDDKGKTTKVQVKELLSFLVYEDPLKKCDFRPYMLSSTHNEEVADYINKEIIQHISEQQALINVPKRKRDSKLERIMKQTVMAVECLSDPSKYQSVRKRRNQGSNQTQQIARNIGLKVPHYDLGEQI